MLNNKKVAIIGGGPGGLTLARLLQLKGVDVKVYERDINRDTRVQGGALDLHEESGLAALQEAGLLDAFKASYRPGAEKMRITDSKATILHDDHLEESTEDFGNKNFRPEIDRGPLRDILLDSLQPGTVVWNSHIVALEPAGESWKILFQNSPAADADLVIGADGANSKTRPYLTAAKPVWAGVTMIEGIVYDSANTAPRIHALLKGGKIFAFGNGKTLLVSSKGDGNFGFATGCKTSEDWVRDCGINFKDNRQVLAWFKEEFSDWDPVWHELFGNEKTAFIPRPQYCMPLNQSWKAKPNITLIGDAAHWMPPYAGEGVNMAMLDALQLSRSLTDPAIADTQNAIARYEKKMLARFAKTGQATLFNTEWMHQPGALQSMLSMFSKNIVQSGIFLGRMWINVSLLPFLRRMAGLSPKQTVSAT